MTTLLVSLFGKTQIAYGDWSQEVQVAPAAQSLFAYLLLNEQRPHPRSRLVGLFWPDYDEERARNCLNTTLWRLRSALEAKVPRGTYLLTTQNGDVAFNSASDHWLDVAAFEQCLQLAGTAEEAITPAQAAKLAEAVDLYRADLLEGCYDNWALQKREQLRETYLGCLTRLMHYHRQREELGQSIDFARRILHLDPLREHVHRQLIQLYVAQGHRSQALRQYEQCRDVLAAELQVAPMPETQALYASLAGVPAGLNVAPAEREQIWRKLETVLTSLAQTERQVRELMALVAGNGGDHPPAGSGKQLSGRR